MTKKWIIITGVSLLVGLGAYFILSFFHLDLAGKYVNIGLAFLASVLCFIICMVVPELISEHKTQERTNVYLRRINKRPDHIREILPASGELNILFCSKHFNREYPRHLIFEAVSSPKDLDSLRYLSDTSANVLEKFGKIVNANNLLSLVFVDIGSEDVDNGAEKILRDFKEKYSWVEIYIFCSTDYSLKKG